MFAAPRSLQERQGKTKCNKVMGLMVASQKPYWKTMNKKNENSFPESRDHNYWEVSVVCSFLSSYACFWLGRFR